MDIKRAKQEIEHAVKAYLAVDDTGTPLIPPIRQRPILLMGPPGVGKTQIMEQIAQEGAIQIFREVGGGMEEVVVGVVGVLQLEVLEYRLNTEYNVEIRMQQLPFEQLRWIQNDPDTYVLRDLDLTSDTKAVEDMKGNRLLLFTSDWAIRWAETHNETLKLSEFGNI